MAILIDREALRPWISKAVMGWIELEPVAKCGTCKWWAGEVCGNVYSDKHCTGMGEEQLCECWEVKDGQEAASEA